jgi:hypothetical protein
MANLFRAGKPLQFCRDYLLLCGAKDPKGGGNGAEAPPPYPLSLQAARGHENPLDKVELEILDVIARVNNQLQQFAQNVDVVSSNSQSLGKRTVYLLGWQVMKIRHKSP